MSSDASSELRPSEEPPHEERRLKKPAARSRQNSPLPGPNTRSPLPTSVMSPHNQDLSKITADMNDWRLGLISRIWNRKSKESPDSSLKLQLRDIRSVTQK
ncbi:hypothetical protein LB505_005278 [Fusarium chuoi]|nr:hypothetical protein LB505_005278 [Fusarium chuoi]